MVKLNSSSKLPYREGGLCGRRRCGPMQGDIKANHSTPSQGSNWICRHATVPLAKRKESYLHRTTNPESSVP